MIQLATHEIVFYTGLAVTVLLAFLLLPVDLRARLTGHRKKEAPSSDKTNLKPGLMLLTIPVLIGVIALLFFASKVTESFDTGITTNGWQSAEQALTSRIPTPQRDTAFYKLAEGQTLGNVALIWGIPQSKLTSLNPGASPGGATIKVPPLEQALTSTAGPNGKLSAAKVIEDRGMIRVSQSHDAATVITNLPELTNFLKSYKAISESGDRVYRLERSISIEGNIRLDITDATVTKVQLRSAAGIITCLCFDSATVLIKGVEITSLDPAINSPDLDTEDGRSFVRAQGGRLDVISSKLTHLGSNLNKGNAYLPVYLQDESGVYGASWSAPPDRESNPMTTGWVENTTFEKNYSGASTDGTSGMTWRNNHFIENSLYGLEAKSATNELIEKNTFQENGKHGLLLAGNGGHNLVQDNLAEDNKLHGYVLYENMDVNLVENNVARGNVDNYVVHQSGNNLLRGNQGYDADKNNIRINEKSTNTYVMNNTFEGGDKGVYVYGGSTDTYVASNKIRGAKDVLTTADAQNVVFAHNSVDSKTYVSAPGDKLILGPNITLNPLLSP